MSDLRKVLITVRQQMQLSEQQFADLLGIRKELLASFEAGTAELDTESLLKVTRFFGVEQTNNE